MTIGRVTQRMLTQGSLDSVQGGLARLARVQEQLTTGRVLNRPSDNPTDTTAAMRVRTAIGNQEQYARNAQDGLGWLTQIDSTLGQVTDSVRKARDLALAGANSGALNQVARDALATEVEVLRQGIVGSANATYLDRPVFGGITSGDRAYDDAGTYVGTVGDVNRRIADGVLVKVDVDGLDVFGTGATSVFAELDALSTALRTGDNAAVSTAIQQLTTRIDTVVSARTAAGAIYERVDKAVQAATDAELALSNDLSVLENADLAATTVELQLAEVAYQASLAATSRVLQPSLVDFLR
ncbi:flagellar hook-associated protein 3 FlgL [Nocardioides thalensis]|uniref:Flagellin n=1 Tax=Nocardioides thalensis TaxID=1914755 RepID=A0A853BYD1_9ACTN|nr:flagellin [Nocardioides thalensis]NYI99846.1 flagellar hook-associated protein 3 FlgL [Nocardioides thalensis]